MKQITLAEASFEAYRKLTRREQFLADMQRVVVECREIFAGLLAINVDTSTSTTTPLDAYERYAATLKQRMQRLRRLFAPTSALRARLTQFVGQHLEHGDRDERIDE